MCSTLPQPPFSTLALGGKEASCPLPPLNVAWLLCGSLAKGLLSLAGMSWMNGMISPLVSGLSHQCEARAWDPLFPGEQTGMLS